jgi:hypothetical protein
MDSESKVLTGLMERRALEADFRGLAALADPEQQAQRAAEIAGHGPVALAVLVSLLNTEEPQQRGALGQVAVLLEREQVIAALRVTARTGEQAARVSALILLERYFGVQPDDSAIAGLGDPAIVALQSLRELVAAMDEEPLSILAYLIQLGQQPPDVPHMILAAVPQAGSSPHLITLLRMLAQDQDQALARAALDQLGRTRSGAAARALMSLAATLPPPLAVLADRCRVKAMMSGGPRHGPVTCAPFDAPDRRWRVLLSAPGGAGSQIVTFFGSAEEAQNQDDDNRIVITVTLDDAQGVKDAYGSLAESVPYLSEAVKPRTVYGIQIGDTLAWFAETSLRTGRQVLREALALNWARHVAPPLPYRLFNSLIWLADEAEAAESDGPVEPETPGEAGAGEAIDMAALAALLQHPALADWHWPVGKSSLRAARSVVAEERRGAGRAPRGELITRIAQTEFAPQAKERYAKRLQKMSAWLALAGSPDAATGARAAAAELLQGAAEESLFVRWLIARGIDAVSNDASKKTNRRLSPKRDRREPNIPGSRT